MTTRVKFLNGLNTIGGNVISVETKTSRVITDFGINFAPDDTTPDDLLSSGVLPNVPDLFLDGQSSPFENEAIFISHLHIDHMGGLKYLKRPIDVYMSSDSLKLYNQLIELGVEKPTLTNLKEIDDGQTITIGDLSVTAYLTDHDAIGALMFVIGDGEHTFVHSGDVRYDGPYPERVDRWTNIIEALNPDLFMLEGTEFSFDNDGEPRTRRTEQILQDDFAKSLSADSLVVINPYERNIERLIELQKTAEENNRTLVWDARFGTILESFGLSATILDRDITLEEMVSNPSQYVLQNHFENLSDLDEFEDGFIYLHMNGEPLGDYDSRYETLVDYLNKRHAQFEYVGASGHATPEDLIKVASRVNAKVTVPWHSFKPEVENDALIQAGLKTYLPTKNETLEF
ncbi:MAG: MBL fold metallo-hydrolase [Lactobacillaceae bacterium]|jgi:ribonuclease J|nr:MBL fold metallo-hydrolase [Lactobacillaceae bacterium]